MKYEFVSCIGARKLILIYTGWAMDATPFRTLSRPGYDVAVVWDYRDLGIDWSFAAPYQEICIVAWSLGVYAASVTAGALSVRTTARIAVNGTLFPVDRRLGIPPAIFEGTAKGLNERQLQKFYRRVCGGGEAFVRFCENKPSRCIDELVQELDVFLEDNLFQVQKDVRWDYAIISSEDAIFPPVNQWRAWQGTPTVIIDGPHMLDMQKIIDRFIIDKEQTATRFARGLDSYGDEATVQSHIAGLLERIIYNPIIFKRISVPGSRTLEIGSGTGMLSQAIDRAVGEGSFFEMWDIAGKAPVTGPLRSFKNVDAELELWRLPSSSFDLIASASTVQWFNSSTRFLSECRRILAPGGYLVLSTFVKGNLRQISDVTGRSLPLLTSGQWRTIIPDGFSPLYIRSFKEELEFDSPLEVFRHLKFTGVDSLGRGTESFNPVAAVRRLQPDLDGKYRLTYRPVIIILKKEQ